MYVSDFFSGIIPQMVPQSVHCTIIYSRSTRPRAIRFSLSNQHGHILDVHLRRWTMITSPIAHVLTDERSSCLKVDYSSIQFLVCDCVGTLCKPLIIEPSINANVLPLLTVCVGFQSHADFSARESNINAFIVVLSQPLMLSLSSWLQSLSLILVLCKLKTKKFAKSFVTMMMMMQLHQCYRTCIYC